MNSNETLIDKTEAKRVELIKEINKEKYSYINISPKDNQANELFLQKIVQTFIFPEDLYYNLAMKYKNEIEKNEFFQILQKMPKGCLLHHHMTDCIDIEWISKEIMKEENLKYIYMRKFRDKFDILIFTKKQNETEKNSDKPFKDIIEEYLKENKDKTVYDYFYSKLTMLPEEIEKAKSNEEGWEVFMPKYFFCYFLILNKNFYQQHIRNTFIQCINDKIYRLESRINPGIIRNDNYELINIDEEFEIYKKEIDYINNSMNLKTKFSFGLIIAMSWRKSDEELKIYIQDSIALKKKYPDLICGLESFENKNYIRNYHDLTPVLITNDTSELPYIMHAGETIKGNNYNILDSFLLGVKRIGHATNLYKLGSLCKIIKEKGIILEINPISNQTLRLVRDLRIHPCIAYHNNGVKICISNDDPTLYNTKGVCYDWFVAAVTMEFNLLDFKCFAINSIEGSQISEEIKNIYKSSFLKEWDKFLDILIEKYNN